MQGHLAGVLRLDTDAAAPCIFPLRMVHFYSPIEAAARVYLGSRVLPSPLHLNASTWKLDRMTINRVLQHTDVHRVLQQRKSHADLNTIMGLLC